jgi:hypothetical protein
VVVWRSSVVDHWGSSSDERRATYPCDGLIEDADVVFRAVDVDAPTPLLFRWMCQLRRAPYSYDWIDNLGRQSPRHLSDGLDDLEVGQHFMTIFRLISFDAGSSITLSSSSAMFGRVVCTYKAIPIEAGQSRLVVKLIFSAPPGLRGWITRRVLPAGDLLMMRKQLLTLKRLVERDSLQLGL